MSDQSILLQKTTGFIQTPGTAGVMLGWPLGGQSPHNEPGSEGNKTWVFFPSVKVKKPKMWSVSVSGFQG